MTTEMKKSIRWIVIIAFIGIVLTIVTSLYHEHMTVEDVYNWINASQMLLSC